jgi:hypothetical protein
LTFWIAVRGHQIEVHKGPNYALIGVAAAACRRRDTLDDSYLSVGNPVVFHMKIPRQRGEALLDWLLKALDEEGVLVPLGEGIDAF